MRMFIVMLERKNYDLKVFIAAENVQIASAMAPRMWGGGNVLSVELLEKK